MNKSVINEWLDQHKRKLSDPSFKKHFLALELARKASSSLSSSSIPPLCLQTDRSNTQRLQQIGTAATPYSSSSVYRPGVSMSSSRAESPPTSKKIKLSNPLLLPFSLKKNVKFFEEKNIVRRFRKEDEPAVCARDMSEEEVTAYQIAEKQRKGGELTSASANQTGQDMRSRESQLEKDKRIQAKECERREREKLDAIIPDIAWSPPILLAPLPAVEFPVYLCLKSTEKEAHTLRIESKIQALFCKEEDIPAQPSYSNILNDKPSTSASRRILLNKLEEDDFIQIIEMSIKNERGESLKKQTGGVTGGANEKKGGLKSILKRPKDDKERIHRKTLEDRRRLLEEEERVKKNIDPKVLEQLIVLIKGEKSNSKEDITAALKRLRLEESQLQNIFQNFNVIKRVQQHSNISSTVPSSNSNTIPRSNHPTSTMQFSKKNQVMFSQPSRFSPMIFDLPAFALALNAQADAEFARNMQLYQQQQQQHLIYHPRQMPSTALESIPLAPSQQQQQQQQQQYNDKPPLQYLPLRNPNLLQPQNQSQKSEQQLQLMQPHSCSSQDGSAMILSGRTKQYQVINEQKPYQANSGGRSNTSTSQPLSGSLRYEGAGSSSEQQQSSVHVKKVQELTIPNHKQEQATSYHHSHRSSSSRSSKGKSSRSHSHSHSHHRSSSDSDRNTPCRRFHSEVGCKRYACPYQHFIEYAGRSIPHAHSSSRSSRSSMRDCKDNDRNLENNYDYTQSKYSQSSSHSRHSSSSSSSGGDNTVTTGSSNNSLFSDQQQPSQQKQGGGGSQKGFMESLMGGNPFKKPTPPYSTSSRKY